MGLCIVLGRDIVAVRILPALAGIRIFTLDGKKAVLCFNLKADKPFSGIRLSGGFQCVVKHIHKQLAQIAFRNGKLRRNGNKRLKADVRLGGTISGVLQDRIDCEIFGKLRLRQERLFYASFRDEWRRCRSLCFPSHDSCS